MRPIASALLLVVLAGSTGKAFAQAPAAGRPQAAPAAQAETAAPDVLADKVAGFITDFYLSGERRSDEELVQLYAPTVAYFDNQVWTRERILADKRAYYAKWPQRDYRLIRETLKVERRPAKPQVLDVTFEYEFDVASPARTSRGRGRGQLTLDLTIDGGRITRETGVVLQRW